MRAQMGSVNNVMPNSPQRRGERRRLGEKRRWKGAFEQSFCIPSVSSAPLRWRKLPRLAALLFAHYHFAIAFLISLCALPVSAQARSTVDDYEKRLARAERTVKEAIERNSPASELAPMMNDVKRLLPASEEVEFNGGGARGDNGGLY